MLSGQVEVDETYIGGEEPGLRGGRAKGKKALVAIAVEVKSPKGFGRCRMRIIRSVRHRQRRRRLDRDHRRMVRLPGHRGGRLLA